MGNKLPYREMGEWNKALADLDRAIVLNPKNAWAIERREQVYQAMEKDGEALADAA